MLRSDQGKYRKDYTRGGLNKSSCPSDPFKLLALWLDEAVEQSGDEPSMVLSTVGGKGRPSSRVVLLKGLDDKGLYFYSNYKSRKGRELSSNPYAAANFFWQELERQIRIEGVTERIPAVMSDLYFETRPEEARINAVISPQSEKVPDRDSLIQMQKQFSRDLESGKKTLERPEYWGGYVIIPSVIEFWQGRSGRLHDRIEYRKKNTDWEVSRLAP